MRPGVLALCAAGEVMAGVGAMGLAGCNNVGPDDPTYQGPLRDAAGQAAANAPEMTPAAPGVPGTPVIIGAVSESPDSGNATTSPADSGNATTAPAASGNATTGSNTTTDDGQVIEIQNGGGGGPINITM